jgi:hypothetical protein
MSRDHTALRAFHLADALAICIYRETADSTDPPENRSP